MTDPTGRALRAWTAEDLRRDTGWIQRLDADAVAGIERALAHARSTGKDWFAMTAADFPVGEAARAALRRAYGATQQRFGLCLLKGFPVQRWSADDARLALWGVGLHVGVARPQNAASDVMTDVRDEGAGYRVKGGRGYNTNAALDFHVDSCDVVSLMCLHPARSGGRSKVTSAIALRDAIAAVRPDLLRVLQEPLHYSLQGAGDPARPPHYPCPIFARDDEAFACRLNRKNVIAAQRDFDDVPRLVPRQIEALDLLDALMPDERYCFEMDLERGDLQLVNNHAVVHSRTAFEDHPQPALRRHLLRLWLDLPGSQRLPAGWRHFYADVRAGTVRGGNRGSRITPEFLAYEARQARALGMTIGAAWSPDVPH